MERARSYLLLLVAGVFLISGCAALAVGGAAAVTGTGTYFYINGELKTDYHAPFEKVWAACEKTVADMRGVDVTPSRDISKGTIDAVIEGEKVQFTVNYKAKDVTSVAIRVGAFGDRLASQRLNDKVGENLAKD
jgi:hypothetical protein